ncbi:hypothetical protein [Nocardioides sp. GCM10030258]|uniref:hypothetical protein n=1 Tax=unclassified Nocardioides TaxID=2615069 RepID=UPI003622C528
MGVFMQGVTSRRALLRVSAATAGGAGVFAALNSTRGPSALASPLSEVPLDLTEGLVVAVGSWGQDMVAVVSDGAVTGLRRFSPSSDPGVFAAAGDLAEFPASFVAMGVLTSSETVSVFGGEWTVVGEDSFERGTVGITVPDVAASETIVDAPSLENIDVVKMLPRVYEYSEATGQLTALPSPEVSGADQAIFIETLLPGSAALIGILDAEDLENVEVRLALWALDGSIALGVPIGVASAILDIVVPPGGGSLFAFAEEGEPGSRTVTPTLLGLVPLPLASTSGEVVASSRTALGSMAIVHDNGVFRRWTPITGWVEWADPPWTGADRLVGVGGGATTMFAVTNGVDAFRVVEA